MALLATGDSGAALKELAETARLDPNDPAADHVAGRIHASAKRFDAAIASFDKALGIRPDFLPALSDRADLHAELGHDALAAADYERLLVLSPKNATASLKLGMVYQRLNRMDDASKAYRSALAMNADLPVAWNNLAMIALRRNEDPAQAVAWAKRAVALAPKVPQFQDTLGWSYRAQGDRTRAIAALETASRLPPPQADILFRLGTVYEESDRRADAKAAYTRALSLKSDFPDAALARARLSALSK
jgi:tetratricopeptide (TPR) repeat protein